MCILYIFPSLFTMNHHNIVCPYSSPNVSATRLFIHFLLRGLLCQLYDDAVKGVWLEKVAGIKASSLSVSLLCFVTSSFLSLWVLLIYILSFFIALSRSFRCIIALPIIVFLGYLFFYLDRCISRHLWWLFLFGYLLYACKGNSLDFSWSFLGLRTSQVHLLKCPREPISLGV